MVYGIRDALLAPYALQPTSCPSSLHAGLAGWRGWHLFAGRYWLTTWVVGWLNDLLPKEALKLASRPRRCGIHAFAYDCHYVSLGRHW